MNTPAFMTGSWKTTVLGVLAGMFAYLTTLGPHLPTNTEEWGQALLAALLAALGSVAKDGNKTNAPSPTTELQTMPMFHKPTETPKGKP